MDKGKNSPRRHGGTEKAPKRRFASRHASILCSLSAISLILRSAFAPCLCASVVSLLLLSTVTTAFAAEPEGTLLTHTGTEKRDLVCRDAETLVFCEQVNPRQLALMQVSLKDETVSRVHPDFRTNEFEPTYSPDGKTYAFLQNMGNLNLRLVIKDRATNTESSFQKGGFSGMRSPCFTADSREVLYSYPEGGRQPIWICDLKCSNRRKLTDSTGINNWPTVTPDGKTVVFSSTRDGNYELYACDLKGENVRRLTDEPRQDIRPRISPDGTTIAFTSNRDGDYEIYTLPLTGGPATRVTNQPERDDYPAWTTAGEIVYVEELRGRFDIRKRPRR